MKLTEVHARLRQLDAAIFTTNDAATWLRIDGNIPMQPGSWHMPLPYVS